MKRSLTLCLLMALAYSSQLLAETAYVQARKADIHSEPNIKAGVLAVAKKGDAVEVEITQGRWVKVNFGGTVGWVSSLLIKSEPPKDKITVLKGTEENIGDNARRRASATAAAAAARGLRSEGRARASDDANTDFDALNKMEKTGVSDQEAVEFVEEGTK